MKRLLSVLLVTIAVLMPTKSWAADGVSEPYAVLSADSLTVTFYYDDQKQARGGMDITNYYRSTPSPYAIATTAVIDASFANYQPTSTAYWFAMCSSLTSITGMENINTADVTDMGNMFRECRSLTSLDVSHFNTQNVKSMTLMFYECSGLTSLDVTQFDTQNVTDMVYMFGGCSGLTSIDVSKFNTAKVASMAYMFSYCSSLTSLDVSHFNTEEMTGMGGMFRDCSGLTSLDVSSFNTANVTDMSSMFHGCTGLTSLDLSNFNTANVTYMDYMFGGCSSLTTIYAGSGWSTAAVTRGLDAFINCSNLKGGAGTTYDYNHIDHTYAHIDGGTANPGYFTDKNAASIEPYAVLSDNNTVLTFYYDNQKTTRNGMGVGPFEKEADRGWSGVLGINQVVFDESFANCTSITSTEKWFFDLSALTSITGLSNLKTDHVTSMRAMFCRCTQLKSIDVSTFNTSNVTNMGEMFAYTGLESLDLSKFNTSNVTDMYLMFIGSINLTSIDLSSFNTEKVTNMNSMFMNSLALQSVDVSSFTTSNVTDMNNMFYNCPALKTIYAGSGWDTKSVTVGDQMFNYSTSLVGGAGTVYDANHTDYTYAHIDGGTANPGYFTDKNASPAVVEPYAVLSADGLTVTFYYDDQRAARGGIDINTFLIPNDSISPYGTATTAIIDATFADYRPTSTDYWFMQCNALTSISGMENLKTDSVTSMNMMFNSCYNLTSIDVKGFNTENVTDMLGMFLACQNLTSLDLSSFNTEKVEDMGMMFQYCYNLAELNLSSFNTSNVTSFFQMFLACGSLKNLDITHFNTANVRSMRWMFGRCSGLQHIDLSHFDTRNVQDMGEMFYNDYGLKSLDLSNFNTENLTNMWCMFKGCSGLTTLDISNFNTDKVTHMQELFQNCTSLQHINMSSFNTAKVEEFRDMFDNCTSMASIQAGSAAIPDSIYAQVNNPNLLVYVNEASLAPSNVQNIVVNGQAREIVLTDVTSGNNNFYVPQAFTAERISYTRNFTQSTQVGVSRGWESIALPFDVQTITHETKGTIAPFGNTASNRHFWLRELGSNGLQSATSIAANTPYVISMPNSSDYTDSYNLAGRVIFAAENTLVPVTEVKASAMADQSIVMIPTMQRQERSSEVWALNVGEVRGRYLEGSVFERDYREVRPFEAYTVHREENSQPAPRYVPLQEIGGTTGIHSVESGELSTEKWYDLNGRQLQGKPSAKGVYINNGQKIVIR